MATHEGWTNYETWCVNLWIDNEEGSHHYWRREAERAYKKAHGDKDDAKHALAEQLKDEFEESMPELEGMWADLLRAALSETNWREIAEAMLEDCGDEDE